MSGTAWIPPNIAAICPEQQAPITQCSLTGYLYLALLLQLYSRSKTNEFQEELDYLSFDELKSLPHLYKSSELVGSSLISSDISKGTGHSLFNFEDNTAKKFSGPLKSSSEVHSHGPGGSHGVSQVSSSYYPTFDFEKHYKESDRFFSERGNVNQGPKFEFENSFSSANSGNRHRVGDFDFGLNKNLFADAEPAYSEKVQKKAGGKRNRRQTVTERYDFIVVGAGSAGCVVANRLSEVKKWKVLLIEAGPEEPEITSVPALAPVLGRSSIDWNYRTQPEEMTCRAQRGQTCAWLSGRVMGGSSAINYVVYMRGNAKDYDEWAALGNEGWSYKDVLPYFKKSEKNRNVEAYDTEYHGTTGPLNVERFAYTDPNVGMLITAFFEKGFPLVDFNGKHQIGAMTTQTTTNSSRRVSANDAFIKPIRGIRPNLKVLTNAQVIRVLLNKGKSAYGVQYRKNNRTEIRTVYASKEVILCAGALNSPKILMLSGIGPKSYLRNLKIPVIMDLKVGYNLQDHATTEAVLMELSNKTSTSLSREAMLKAIDDFHKYGTRFDEISATGPLQITAFYRTKYAPSDKSVPDIQFHFDGRNKEDFYKDPTTYLATNIFPFSFYDSINVRPILLRPKSRGYLTLNTTHPISGQPLIYPGFFTVKQDLDTLVEALKFATTLEDTSSFETNEVTFMKRPVQACTQHIWGTDEYFACVIMGYTGTIYHPAGTCKMGPIHDKDAVVDARLRVHGVRNLRVADASIMPNIVRGNTNAPCMMIGEKVADMIKEDWEQSFWKQQG